MANIGEQLLVPESGWKRYDDTDGNIVYNGTGWQHSPGAIHYNNDCILTQTPGENYVLYVYTSRIRIISEYHFNMGIFTINIDDNYSCDVDCYQTGEQYQVLMFEKTDLEKNIHKITVTLKEKVHPGLNDLILDAIDIDEDGFLLSDKAYNYIKTLSQSDEIVFNKVLKRNLPTTVKEKIGIYFTDDKGMYINKNDGTLININHNHINEDVLDLLSEDDNNNLLFDGNEIALESSDYLTDTDKSNIISSVFDEEIKG